MPQFDSKTFNAEVFGKYLERVPRVKQDKLLEAGVLRPRRALRALLGDHAGGNYITVPMLGLIDGEPLNYDGETDLTAVSTRTYAQSMVVVGRMKAWEEKDFAADITGADFMDNVAMQVAEYWDGVDEDTLLAIQMCIRDRRPEAHVVRGGIRVEDRRSHARSGRADRRICGSHARHRRGHRRAEGSAFSGSAALALHGRLAVGAHRPGDGLRTAAGLPPARAGPFRLRSRLGRGRLRLRACRQMARRQQSKSVRNVL